MNKHSRKQVVVLGILILVILTIHLLTPKIVSFQERKKVEESRSQTMEKIKEIKGIETIDRAYLEVPFICQAPLETEANWEFHEESCEEAALLQAMLYESSKKITKEQANETILDMINWEKKHFGAHKDLYGTDMKNFILGYYQLTEEEVELIPNASINDIKKAILDGHPIIVPITGEILQNPYYPYPGYHMLTVTGFTEDKIITNDNGTKRGKDFSYDMEIFQKAFKDAGGDIIILKLNKN